MKTVATRPASWEEALDRVAEKLKTVPADRLTLLTDGRLTNEELFRLGRSPAKA